MPNLQGVGPVGRDGEDCSYVAQTADGSGARFGDVEENRRQDAKNGA